MWKFCPECGHKLEAAWKFCADCGKQCNSSVVPAYPYYPFHYDPFWYVPTQRPTAPVTITWSGTASPVQSDANWVYTTGNTQ